MVPSNNFFYEVNDYLGKISLVSQENFAGVRTLYNINHRQKTRRGRSAPLITLPIVRKNVLSFTKNVFTDHQGAKLIRPIKKGLMVDLVTRKVQDNTDEIIVGHGFTATLVYSFKSEEVRLKTDQ